MKSKSDVFHIFPTFKALIENYFKHSIVSVYSDGGGEYEKFKKKLAPMVSLTFKLHLIHQNTMVLLREGTAELLKLVSLYFIRLIYLYFFGLMLLLQLFILLLDYPLRCCTSNRLLNPFLMISLIVTSLKHLVVCVILG